MLHKQYVIKAQNITIMPDYISKMIILGRMEMIRREDKEGSQNLFNYFVLNGENRTVF